MNLWFKRKKKHPISAWRVTTQPKAFSKLILPGEKSPLYRRIFAASLVIALLSWSGFGIKQNQNFPIKHVRVITTSVHLDPQILRDTIANYINHGFFGLDAFALSKELMLIPWVHAVTIQRFWPDKVIVTVEEQNAVAEWNENYLLNAAGEIFTPAKDTFPPNLPKLSGPDQEAANVWKNYVAINKVLQPLKTSISKLDIDKRQSWHLILSNGMSVFLGEQKMMERLTFFVKNYPKLITPETQVAEVVDLRYKNGLAVKWRPVLKKTVVQGNQVND